MLLLLLLLVSLIKLLFITIGLLLVSHLRWFLLLLRMAHSCGAACGRAQLRRAEAADGIGRRRRRRRLDEAAGRLGQVVRERQVLRVVRVRVRVHRRQVHWMMVRVLLLLLVRVVRPT